MPDNRVRRRGEGRWQAPAHPKAEEGVVEEGEVEAGMPAATRDEGGRLPGGCRRAKPPQEITGTEAPA